MKIALCITKSNWGGAQKYVFDVATSMKERGHDVVVIAGGSATGGELFERLGAQNIRVIPLAHAQRNISYTKEFALFFELSRIFKAEKPDVVHVNSSKIGGTGAVAARLQGVPRIIFTNHGWAFNEPRPWWQQSSIRFLSWLTVIFSHRTICLSDIEYQQARSWPFCAKKLIIVPLGITPPPFLSREDARSELGIDRMIAAYPNQVLGTIAELHPNKGLLYMIEAMQQLPTWVWIVVSGGEQQEKLAFEIQARGLGDRVHLLGHVPQAARFLKAFDVFVLPSVKEGLPYTLIEAAYAGVPFIATTVGGIPSFARGGALLVPPADPRALEQAVLSLATPEARAVLTEYMSRHVRIVASLPTMITALEEVYTA